MCVSSLYPAGPNYAPHPHLEPTLHPSSCIVWISPHPLWLCQNWDLHSQAKYSLQFPCRVWGAWFGIWWHVLENVDCHPSKPKKQSTQAPRAPPKWGLPSWDWELIVLRDSLDIDKQRSDLFFFSFVPSCNACMLMCTCTRTQEFCRFSYFQPSYGWDRLSAPQCKWAHRQDGQVIPLEMRSMEVTYGTEMFLLSK